MNSVDNTGPTEKVVAMLPAYNSERTIQRMLDSLDRQTYRNLDVLISDDCSTDGTAQICRRFASSRPNVKLVEQPRNLGWVGNSNYLLRSAAGEFLFFAFDDDELDASYVSKLVAALRANPRAVAAYSDMLFRTHDGQSAVLSFDALLGIKDAYDRARIVFSGSGRLWVIFRSVYRASTCRELGGLRRQFGCEHRADWLWLLGMSLRGEFVRVPEVLYIKNKRPEGVGSQWKTNRWIRLAAFVKGLGAVFASSLPPAKKLRLAGCAVAERVHSLS